VKTKKFSQLKSGDKFYAFGDHYTCVAIEDARHVDGRWEIKTVNGYVALDGSTDVLVEQCHNRLFNEDDGWTIEAITLSELVQKAIRPVVQSVQEHNYSLREASVVLHDAVTGVMLEALALNSVNKRK
jgi:hypothetical protein